MADPIEVRTGRLVGLENVRDAPAHRRKVEAHGKRDTVHAIAVPYACRTTAGRTLPTTGE